MRILEDIKITEEMVLKFSELSGDKNPIHLDEEYSKKTEFGARIVPGILLCSFFSKNIANVYPGEGSIYVYQNVSFKKPCYIGDIVTVLIELKCRKKHKFTLTTNILKGSDILIEGESLIINKFLVH